MSQALRIDPTVIETYSAMLFIDRSVLFGADPPNNAFVALAPAGQAVPSSETIGADVSDRFNVDFCVDGHRLGVLSSPMRTKKNGGRRCTRWAS